MIRGCGRSRTCVNLSHPKGGLCSRTDQPFCLGKIKPINYYGYTYRMN